VRLGVAPDSQGCFHPGPHVGTVVGMKGGHKRAEAAGGQTRSGNRPGQRGQRATSTGKVIFGEKKGLYIQYVTPQSLVTLVEDK